MLKYFYVLDNAFSTQLFVYILIGVVGGILLVVLLFNLVYINRHKNILVINNLFNKKQRIKTNKVVFLVPFFEKVLRVIEPNNLVTFTIKTSDKDVLLKVTTQYSITDSVCFIDNESKLSLELKQYFLSFVNENNLEDLLQKQLGMEIFNQEFKDSFNKQFGVSLGGVLFEKQ